MCLSDSHWDYRIRAYYPPNKGGGLAIETTHRGDASKDVEILVFKERMKCHEISHIEVIDCRTYKMETIYG